MKTTFRNFLFLLGVTFPFQAYHQDPAPKTPIFQSTDFEFNGIEHKEKLSDAVESPVLTQNSMGAKAMNSTILVAEQFLIVAQEANTRYPASRPVVGAPDEGAAVETALIASAQKGVIEFLEWAW